MDLPALIERCRSGLDAGREQLLRYRVKVPRRVAALRPGRESLYDAYEEATRPPVAVRAVGWILFAASLVASLLLYRAELRHVLALRTVYFANIGVLFISAAGLALATGHERMIARPAVPRWEIVAVVVLTAVGALMRTLLWDVFPPADGQLLEEPQVAWNAVRSIRFGYIDAYFPIINAIGEIGFRIIGPTMNGLRIPFVVLGILSVPVFHVAARFFLASPLAALFVTALFATNAMLAGSSRIALESLHPIFTLVLALAVVFYAAQRPTVGKCALAGVFNGILLAEYDSYRLAPLLNFIFLAIRLGILRKARREAEIQVTGKRLLACLLAYGVFVVGADLPRMLNDPHQPLYQLTEAFHRHSSFLAQHRADMSVVDLGLEEAKKFKENLSYLFLAGDMADVLPRSMGHFDVYTGMLGVVALVFCLLGAWWNPVRVFPVIAVALMLVLGTVLVGHTARYRLMPAIPYYLLAVGLLVDAIDLRFPRGRRALASVLLVVAVGLGIVNAHRFFGVAIWDRSVQESFYDLSLVLSHEIAELQRTDPGAHIVVLSDQNQLGVENDYAFWYDYAKVEVFTSAASARGREGYLMAHDTFIPTQEDLPGMHDCVQWTTRFDRNVILRCRLAADG